MDIAEHAKVLAPNLAPNLGQPLLKLLELGTKWTVQTLILKDSSLLSLA